MFKPGLFYDLTISDKTPKGYTLSDIKGNTIDMPLEYSDTGILKGDKLTVFVFQDLNWKTIATTKKPKGKLEDLITLKVTNINTTGAFLDWGLPCPLFLPRSWHEEDLLVGDYCLVKIVFDEVSNKLLGKEILTDELSNTELSVSDKEIVQCIVYKNTPLGYQVIVNKKHLGLLHYNEVFKDLYVGDTFIGFVKKIKDDNRLDIMIGKPGYSRTDDEKEQILKLLRKHNGYLPYHDKSSAEEIYKFFQMSKKTFKMTIGALYKAHKIIIEKEGIRINSEKQ